MSNRAEPWDGRFLGHGPLALIVIPHRKPTQSSEEQPALGIAADGAVTPILLPEQLGLFLQAHQDTVVVCHDAAGLHWLLHGYLADRGQDAAVEALWALSRHARLHDVMLLDQAARRFHGEAMPPDRTLPELAAQRAGLEVIADPPVGQPGRERTPSGPLQRGP